MIIEGPDRERVVNVEVGGNTQFKIGRKGSNNLAFNNDQHLSSVHVAIYSLNQQVLLEDMQTTNGTWLRLSPETKESHKHLLEENTVFKIGANTTFRVYLSNLCILCSLHSRQAAHPACNLPLVHLVHCNLCVSQT